MNAMTNTPTVPRRAKVKIVEHDRYVIVRDGTAEILDKAPSIGGAEERLARLAMNNPGASFSIYQRVRSAVVKPVIEWKGAGL